MSEIDNCARENVRFLKIGSDSLRVGAAKDLKEMDIYIYCAIKRFHNSKTNECYPCMDVIAKEASVSKETVRNSVQKLSKSGIIKVTKHPVYKSNQYTFLKDIRYEMFFYDFLYRKDDLTKHEKAFLIMMRQYMYGDTESCFFTMKEIAERIGLSYSTVRKRISSLKDKGYITESFVFTYGKPRTKFMFDYNDIAVRVKKVEEELEKVKSKQDEHEEKLNNLNYTIEDFFRMNGITMEALREVVKESQKKAK